MPRKQDRWIGLLVSPPQVGVPLVIGRVGAVDFRVTSPVTLVIERADGILVCTGSSRYLVGIMGNTYLMHDEPEAEAPILASGSATLPRPRVSRSRLESHADPEPAGVTVTLRRRSATN